MTREDILKLLKTEYMGRNLYCFERINSTNDFLKEMAPQLPDGTVAMAEEQTAGKGRRGKKWASAKGEAVEFSILVKTFKTDAPPVTLICGYAVATALNSLCGGGFFIKWPNDIVCGGKKVCGILCESKISKECSATVCGIGVNVSQDEKFFIKAHLPYGASLKTLKSVTPNNENVATEIINCFEEMYKKTLFGGEKERLEFLESYKKLCITLGREIYVKTQNGEIAGIAHNINADGSLCVNCGDNLVTVTAGNVSVRGVMGYY